MTPSHENPTNPPRAAGEGPTVVPEHEGRGWPQHLAVGHGVGHHAGVVAHVRGLHLGDVEVAGLLRHEAPVVLVHKGGVLVEDPGVGQLCKNKGHAVSRENETAQLKERAPWLLMAWCFLPFYLSMFPEAILVFNFSSSLYSLMPPWFLPFYLFYIL